MDKVFTSTHWRGATRNLLINNERILYVERGQGEVTGYTVTFDNGHTLYLDQGTGEAFAEQLEKLQRASPPIQHVLSQEPKHYPPPRPPRFRASGPY